MLPIRQTRRLAAYRTDPTDTSLHHSILTHNGADVGNAWVIPADWGEYAGKWTFNRGNIPIALEWWPEQYDHPTLEALLEHIDQTMPLEQGCKELAPPCR